jgi:hypothetical protein
MTVKGRTRPPDVVCGDGRSRRNPVVAARSGEGPFTIPFADLAHACRLERLKSYVKTAESGNKRVSCVNLRRRA